MSEYCKNCEALQQENAKLKEELKKYINDKFCQGGCICYQFDTIEKYKQALDEIEKYCNNQIGLTGDLPFRTTESDILDIISKVKGEGNNEG